MISRIENYMETSRSILKNFKNSVHKNVIYNVKKMFGVIDIKGNFDYPSCALSNCAKKGYVYGFEFDGVKCHCMEGFLQSLKCSDIEQQEYICSLGWKSAQKEGRAIDWKSSQILWWKGQAIDRHSKEYQELLDRAYEAVMTQNEGYQKALLDTGSAKLVHSIGVKKPECTILTEHEFCSRLMGMRDRIRNGLEANSGKDLKEEVVMEDQKEYWDKVAMEKQFTTPFRLDLFSEYVSKDDCVLDYGCGYGRTLLELNENGYSKISGIDFSKEMIARAKSINNNIDFSVIDSAKVPFEDNSFDAVLLLAVLTCVHNNQEQENIIREIKRVLKPEGVLYINDFLLNDDERNISRYEKFAKKYGTYGIFELEEGAIVRHHNEARVAEITKEFEKLVCEEVEYTTMNGNKSNGFLYMGRNKK